MIDASSELQDFDARNALTSAQPGLRFGWYAYLLAKTDTRLLKDLVRTEDY